MIVYNNQSNQLQQLTTSCECRTSTTIVDATVRRCTAATHHAAAFTLQALQPATHTLHDSVTARPCVTNTHSNGAHGTRLTPPTSTHNTSKPFTTHLTSRQGASHLNHFSSIINTLRLPSNSLFNTLTLLSTYLHLPHFYSSAHYLSIRVSSPSYHLFLPPLFLCSSSVIHP